LISVVAARRLAALICVIATLAPLGAGVAGAAQLSRVDIGSQAPPFSARGADGQEHRLSDYAGRVVVLEWTSPVCPFTAVKYKSGAMQALQRYAASQHMVWLSIDTADPGKAGFLTAAAARARIARTHARVTAFLFDPTGEIGRSYGAKVTPSFFIVDGTGKLVYQGDMDDVGLGLPGTGRSYLHSALDELAAGRPVSESETQPHGCAIEY
jgi:hypothetical protein